MSGKVLVVGHTDGHGVACTAVTLKYFAKKGYHASHLCKFPETGVISKFWNETFNEILDKAKDYDLVVILDIPLDARNPEACVEKLKELAKCTEVVYIDHHETSKPYAGDYDNLTIEVVDRAIDCYYGDYDYFTHKWMTIGAICDRDTPSVQKKVDRKWLKIADGLDVAVRKNIDETIKAILDDDEDYFIELADQIPKPEIAEVHENVVVVTNVPEGWKFKVLDKACREKGKPYAVTLSENVPDKATGEPRDFVTAIKFWLSDKPSVKPLLPEELRKIAIGHPDAVTVSVTPGDGKKVLDQIANILNSV